MVGAGPAGCFTGKLLAKLGFDVTILEEHPQVGNPMVCAGVVGAGGLRELGIKPSRGWVLTKLRGAVFYPPKGEPVELSRGRVEAYVINRSAFDRWLAWEAVRAGAELRLQTRCVGVKLEGGRAEVKARGPGGELRLRARLVVGADGSTSTVAKQAGLIKRSKLFSAAQLETQAEVKPSMAEVYFGEKFAPGFFAWMVRAGETCRVGLGTTRGSALLKLLNFIKHHPIASKKVGQSFLHLALGVVPEPFSRRICSRRVMLVGDAAAHLKPLTWGGIYLGLTCARLASKAAAQALQGRADEVLEYEREVRRRLGDELGLELRARRFFLRLGDQGLSSLLKLVGHPRLKSRLLERADFDHHGASIKALLEDGPSIAKALGFRGVMKLLKGFLQR